MEAAEPAFGEEPSTRALVSGVTRALRDAGSLRSTIDQGQRDAPEDEADPDSRTAVSRVAVLVDYRHTGRARQLRLGSPAHRVTGLVTAAGDVYLRGVISGQLDRWALVRRQHGSAAPKGLVAFAGELRDAADDDLAHLLGSLTLAGSVTDELDRDDDENVLDEYHAWVDVPATLAKGRTGAVITRQLRAVKGTEAAKVASIRITVDRRGRVQAAELTLGVWYRSYDLAPAPVRHDLDLPARGLVLPAEDLVATGAA